MSSVQNDSRPPTLPALAAVGAACYQCYSPAPESVKLQKCSGCRLVSYCNSACQHESWPSHKQFCKVIASFEKPHMVSLVATWIGRGTPEELESQFKARLLNCQLQLGRELSPHESTLLQFEPRCLHCARTDQLIRIESSTDSSVNPHALVPCSHCHLSFACPTHWALVYTEHTQMMCEGGYDGLPQCTLNQELIEDDEWDAQMLLRPVLPSQYCVPLRAYRWIPPNLKYTWTSLKDVTWAEKFQAQLEVDFPEALASVSMRRMSDVLSMPMTALYALECLNDNLDWTKKDVLTIHMIGAQSKEMFNAVCFENILHQLPAVKLVKLIVCGVELVPHLGDDMRNGPYQITCCQDCQRRGKMRGNEYYDVHYHDLPRKMGGTYTVPDLAIAFNSGASEFRHAAAWKKTAAFLVSRNIPSVFTAYTANDAIADSRILLDAHAKLVPELGPCRNPWGSLLGKKDFGPPRGFYSDNMFLAGGFKGR
ncbi:MYND-type domain-containing protein [Mycena venus]|uniref:MYND-type domain-containing protein n=1 Tax=Mycena venus TaxID=2733690 RepID=A0A8H7CHJ1_9AGAR|nr:MYND-type domain-containing protein [Mycena venus]